MHVEFVIRLLIGETEGFITIKYDLKKKRVINFHFQWGGKNRDLLDKGAHQPRRIESRHKTEAFQGNRI